MATDSQYLFQFPSYFIGRIISSLILIHPHLFPFLQDIYFFLGISLHDLTEIAFHQINFLYIPLDNISPRDGRSRQFFTIKLSAQQFGIVSISIVFDW